MAYSNLAQLRMLDHDLEGTLRWGNRAIALAEELGETETLVHALANVGAARRYAGDDLGREELTRSLQLALDHGLLDHAGRALTYLAWSDDVGHAARRGRAPAGHRHRLRDRARSRLPPLVSPGRRGRRCASVKATGTRQRLEIRQLLRQPMLSPVTRMVALTTLGQVCARRGSPEAAATLDEALALAERTGNCCAWDRSAPRAPKRPSWMATASERERKLQAVRDLVFERGNRWQRGEFAWLLWQAGERDVPTDNLAEPYALLIAGDLAGAAAAWHELGCPYEEACALAASDDPALVRRAVAIFEELGAQARHHAGDRVACVRSACATCQRCGADRGPRPAPIRPA